MKRIGWLGLVLCLVCAAGCQPGPRDSFEGSTAGGVVDVLERVPVVASVQVINSGDVFESGAEKAFLFSSRHYDVYTTLTDPLVLRQVPVFLEHVFAGYLDLSGVQVADGGERQQVYFFATREEWEQFTRYWAGEKAEHYLKLRAGAYYFNGACVAYFISRRSTFTVLGHEGWHEFGYGRIGCALPAWLDEGMATQFESYHWADGEIVFEPQFNTLRLKDLRRAVDQDLMFELGDLLQLDAGHILSYRGEGETLGDKYIGVYYAQVYALVRFLRESDEGRYLAGMQRMISDGQQKRWPLSEAMQKEAYDVEGFPTRGWNAAVGPALFKAYIGDPVGIEKAYRLYCRRLAAQVR